MAHTDLQISVSSRCSERSVAHIFSSDSLLVSVTLPLVLDFSSNVRVILLTVILVATARLELLDGRPPVYKGEPVFHA
jgi:hypothetical protein